MLLIECVSILSKFRNVFVKLTFTKFGGSFAKLQGMDYRFIHKLESFFLQNLHSQLFLAVGSADPTAEVIRMTWPLSVTRECTRISRKKL